MNPCAKPNYDQADMMFHEGLEGTRTIRKIGDMIRLRDEKGVDRLELVPRATW